MNQYGNNKNSSHNHRSFIVSEWAFIGRFVGAKKTVKPIQWQRPNHKSRRRAASNLQASRPKARKPSHQKSNQITIRRIHFKRNFKTN